ncbi:MAG: hypothetical protein JWM40_1149 [Frankiales bacterium]|nr:hypothetical protein [Frankiales bacterium]
MRIKRLAVVLGVVLALGGSVVAAPPSQACLVPCNLTVKSAGAILGGGIPSDFYSFQINGMFRGQQGFKTVSYVFRTYVNGEGSYNNTVLGNQYFSGSVSMTKVPGIDGAPSIGLISINGYSGAQKISGYLTGQIGGTKTAGYLTVTAG